jgi:hypothetical protein
VERPLVREDEDMNIEEHMAIVCHPASIRAPVSSLSHEMRRDPRVLNIAPGYEPKDPQPDEERRCHVDDQASRKRKLEPHK